jgi:hypothetical protein
MRLIHSVRSRPTYQGPKVARLNHWGAADMTVATTCSLFCLLFALPLYGPIGETL